MYSKQNQAVTMYPLFFDPFYKKACFEEKNGKVTISYKDDLWGVRLEENNDVTFTMYAPNAKTVEVSGISGSMSGERIALDRKEDGTFSKTVSGIPQGFHYHNWFVDGARVVNPIAPIAYGCFGATNFFEIPRSGDDFWLMKDVPHGDVQFHTYVSRVNHHVKRCLVYTPPAYGRDPEKKYPVLYILHGVGEDETGWVWNGKLNFVMDNLIAEGKCQEMIVVMCCGYAFREGEDPVFYPGDFGRELTGDCIPYIESTFAVRKGRSNRAIAGLSLGSAQAIKIAGEYQHLFAHLGVFSGVRDRELETVLANMDQYPMQTVLLTSGVGEKGLDQMQREYAARFEPFGVAGGQRSYEGFHEWHVWRESLRDYATMIFRNDCKEAEDAFEYTEEKLPVAQLDKQTFAEHLLMFDPIYKGLILAVDEAGRPAGKYKDEPCGYRILDAATGRAGFWFRSKEAESVTVDIWGMKPAPMTKGEDDWWTCEVEGIEKGFHYYGLKVNGVDVVDGNAPVGYGGFRAINYLEMPEEDFEEYRYRQVPHGTIHMNYYRSEETGRNKLCYVYTPASYDREPEKRYPVLYLQHGGGENEMGWIWQGKIANLADNLIAQRQMQEMIIVMNTGYGFPEDRPYHPSMGAFLEEITGCSIRFIDAHYRTVADREHRAMAGLSMGAMQTQKVVLEHPELFAWAGIFSGTLTIRSEEADYSDVLLNREEFLKRYKLLFVACGTKEGFYETVRRNEDTILAANVPIEVFEGYGYHDWTFWRHCAKAFLPKLFQA